MNQRTLQYIKWITAALVVAAVLSLTTCGDFALKQTIDELVLGWSRAVTLSAPANEERRADKTPLLDWEDAGGATGYELQIVESADQLESAEIISVIESQYEIPDPLVFSDERSWRVRAVKEGEAEPGPWSETWSFEIIVSESPEILGEVLVGGLPYKLAIHGDYMYIPQNETNTGLKIVDISDVTKPTVVHTINKKASDAAVDTEGRFLYLLYDNSSGVDQVEIYDISTPSSPVLKGACDCTYTPTDYSPNDCVIFGDYLYVIGNESGGSGILVVDISNPSAPSVDKFVQYPLSVQGYYMNNELLYIYTTVDGGLYSYSAYQDNFSDYLDIDGLFDAFIDVEKNYVYISNGKDNPTGPVSIVDCSSISNLQLVSEYDPGVKSSYIVAREEYLFITTYSWGVHIVDISDKTAPELIFKIEDVPITEIVGNYAYGLTYTTGKLQITDLVPGS